MKKTTKALDLPPTQKYTVRISDYGLPETHEFPMPDEVHLRAAEAYFMYAPDEKKPLLAHRIRLKAKKLGIEVQSPVVLSWAKKYRKRTEKSRMIR